MAVDVRHAGSLLPLLDEGKPDARGWIPRRIVMGLIALAVIVWPYIPIFQPRWVAQAMIFVIVGLSINILIGYAGQVSLGHQAFVGVGAFTSAILVSKAGLPFYVAVVFAAATGAAAALILGLVALRLKGLYLALITLAYGEIARSVIFGIPVLTGGGAGTEAPRPPGFSGERAFVYLCMAFVGLVLFMDFSLMRSKAGRAILAIRDNEIAAASFGINVVAYKLLAFILSGAVAGVAGSLFAHLTERVTDADFTFELALTFVLMTVVGGLGSRAGIFLASSFFAIFPLALEALLYWTRFIGAALLLFSLVMHPGGTGQLIRPLVEWLKGKPFSMKHESGGIQAGGAGVRP